jgi:hypothetical protein
MGTRDTSSVGKAARALKLAKEKCAKKMWIDTFTLPNILMA